MLLKSKPRLKTTLVIVNVNRQNDAMAMSHSPFYRHYLFSLLQIQGALIVASLFEISLGVIGLIGMLLWFLGPIAIASTVCLMGLSLVPAAASFAAKNWYIAVA